VKATQLLARSGNQRQRSVTDLWSGILHNPRAVQQHSPIIEVLAACIGSSVCDDATTT